jgi:putative transposase
MDAGARQSKVCKLLGLDPGTVRSWIKQGVGDDGRAGPKRSPKNKITAEERAETLEIVNSPEYRDLSPKQIVPLLADREQYVVSESTIYRILREENQLKHRSAAKPAKRSKPAELAATGPNQVWSWDITYMKSPVRGSFYYSYMIIDVFSRKIVGEAVYEIECQVYAVALIQAACDAEEVDYRKLSIHSDNGSPMKGATMVATLERLGIMQSFSRPSVSNDNPYSESLFRTAKYRPEYPSGAFESLEAARAWMNWFVEWYNNQHLHSAIGFVTPGDRHAGLDRAILSKRHDTYLKARARHPERWSGNTRNWSRLETVRLNPELAQATTEAA